MLDSRLGVEIPSSAPSNRAPIGNPDQIHVHHPEVATIAGAFLAADRAG